MAKIGIVLSGAGSKGAYEYGFLKAVRDYFGMENIKCVSSASIGTLAAQTFGIGKIEDFARIWKSIDPKKHGRIFVSYGASEDILHDIFKVVEADEKLAFEHYVSVWNFTESKAEYIPFHELTREELRQYIRGAIAIPVFNKGEIINGDRILDGAFVDNIPAYPLVNKELDYILCIYFDNHKYMFENPEFDKKVIKFFDFPNQKRFESLIFDPQVFDEMAQYGYDYTTKTLKEIFDHPDKAAIEEAIEKHNNAQNREYKLRLTGDVVLNNLNTVNRKYSKRLSNWEKVDR